MRYQFIPLNCISQLKELVPQVGVGAAVINGGVSDVRCDDEIGPGLVKMRLESLEVVGGTAWDLETAGSVGTSLGREAVYYKTAKKEIRHDGGRGTWT